MRQLIAFILILGMSVLTDGIVDTYGMTVFIAAWTIVLAISGALVFGRDKP